MITNTRTRLLTYTAVALTSSIGFATSAQAACVVTPPATPVAGTVVCGTTTTTDTTYAGVSPAIDRNYNVDTSTTAFTGTVSTGAVVDGFGLAFTNTVGGTNALNVVNNGAIQVNAGNTPTQGIAIGDAALNITAIGATPINYSGTGSMTNLGGGLGDGLNMYSAGTGNITASVGGNVTAGSATTGAGSYGIAAYQAGTAGNVNLTTATGTTVRAGAFGINTRVQNALSTGTVTVTNGAAIASRTGALGTLNTGILATNAGLGSVTVANTGTIGSATDRVTSSGIRAAISNAASAAALSVTGSGAIWSSGTGIVASNAGTGTTTVNYTGAINTTGATGVAVTGGTGQTTVTLGNVTAATDAVTVTSTGTQAITLNGVTTGTTGSGLVSTTSAADPVAPATTPARSITIGTAGNVTGGTQAILLNGTATTTLTNNGIIGAASTGLAINDAGGGITNVTNAAGATINGRMTLGAGNDTVTNAGTIVTQGTTDFGAGTDVLNNQAAGIITLAGNTTFANLETFTQAGTVNLATFTLTGPAITLTNAGTITTTGSAGLIGFTALTNTGTLTLGPGTFTAPTGTLTNSGTVNAKLGATTITGQTSFVNAGGLISLQDGATNDVLTINSNFSASGNSRLALDIDNTTADRLVITGNVTGTATNVLFTPIAGTTGFNTAGILIVDVGGTTVANAFTTTSVLNSVVNFAIEQRGNDFFAIRVPNAAAFSPVLAGNMALDVWYQGAETFNAMAAARGGESVPGGGVSVWLLPYYASDKYGDATQTFSTLNRTYTIANRVRTKRHGAQGGLDFNAGMAAIGVTGGFQQAEINQGEPHIKGWNVGAYAMAGGTAGFYGNLLGKYDRNRIDLDSGAFLGSGLDPRSTSWGVDGEVGYRFPGSDTMTFDASAGIAYVNTDIDEFDFGGINYGFDDLTSMRGRIGGRAVFHNLAKLFVGGKLMHEFDGDTDLVLDSFSDAEVSTEGRGTWARLETEFGGGVETPFMAMAWGDFGDVKGWGVRGGVRFTFGGTRVAEPAPEVLPPPPPPPPEPAPVVEPAPPPPPPPPPEPSGQRG